MPYIESYFRERYDEQIDAVAKLLREQCPYVMRPGHLNYVITRLLLGVLGTEARYANYAEAIGALECVKLELYRTQLGPYEDLARAKNGDVL